MQRAIAKSPKDKLKWNFLKFNNLKAIKETTEKQNQSKHTENI